MVKTCGGLKRSRNEDEEPQPSTSSSTAPSQTRRIYSEQDIRNLLQDLESGSDSDGSMLQEDLETGESDDDYDSGEEIPIIDLTPQEEQETRGMPSIFEEELAPQPEPSASTEEERAETPIVDNQRVTSQFHSTRITRRSRRRGATHTARRVITQNYDWQTDRPTQLPTFDFVDQGSEGLKTRPTDRNPIDYVKMLFTVELITQIVTETNRYANEKIVAPQKQSSRGPSKGKSRISRWKPLTNDEFWVWLALLFHMGHVKLPSITDYWSTDVMYNLQFFRTCMGRDRFQAILSCLHFAPNPPQGTQPLSTLYKLQPLLDHFHMIMKQTVIPTRRLSIDEPLILWRGRLIFQVYLKGKRHKYGLKLYMLCEPSGLVLRIIIYTGAADREVGGPGHVDLVVQKLMEGLTAQGHPLFMENYYNSVHLVHQLLELKTYVTGTLRAVRKEIPALVITKKLSKDEVTSLFTKDGVCVMKWKDRREVLMISSEYGPHTVEIPHPRNPEKTVRKPEMVAKYNESMGGVDHLDQLTAYYPIERKSLKWYSKLGLHIFHLLLTNAFLLFRKDNPNSKMNYIQFRLSVVKTLTSNFTFPSPRPPCFSRTPPP